MTKEQAFAQAKQLYPECKPTRMAGITKTEEGCSLVISGHDEAVCLVLYSETDLHLLRNLADLALQKRKEQ